MSNQLRDDLEGIRNLLEDPARWVKGAEHSPGNGTGGKGDRWCLIGAAKHVVNTTEVGDEIFMNAFAEMTMDEMLDDDGLGAANHQQRINNALQAISNEVPNKAALDTSAIAGFNDAPKRTHADVIKVIDRAIERCTIESEPTTVSTSNTDSPLMAFAAADLVGHGLNSQQIRSGQWHF